MVSHNKKNKYVLFPTQVQKGHTSTMPGRVTDFCDGTHYCTHLLFSEHPKALQIFLYYDDINPLGSSKGKHKLCNHTHIF